MFGLSFAITASWSQIILPADIQDSITELIARIRHRRTVYDTWGFDQNGWTQLLPANSPPPRAFASMTFDSHKAVLFGGASGSQGDGGGRSKQAQPYGSGKSDSTHCPLR